MLRSTIYLSFRGYPARALLNATVQSSFIVWFYLLKQKQEGFVNLSRLTLGENHIFSTRGCKKTELKKTRLTRNLAIVSSLRSLRPSSNVDLFMYRT